MDFTINPQSGIPIYVQLKEKIKYAIATGYYPPGVQLPTVRQLAVDLRINVNTVARVYSELENEGVLITRQGRGTFVAENEIKQEGDNVARLHELLERFLVEAFALGFTPEDVLVCLKKKIEENDRG